MFEALLLPTKYYIFVLHIIAYQVLHLTFLNVGITFMIENTRLNSKQYTMINVQYSLIYS